MDLATIVLFSTMNLTVTSYQSVKEQTDDSPYITSIGDRVSSAGCAVSRDLLKTGDVCYGDVVKIPSVGFRVVNDTMNARIKKTIDVWVPDYASEKKIGKRLNQKVVVIKSKYRRCGK